MVLFPKWGVCGSYTKLVLTTIDLLMGIGRSALVHLYNDLHRFEVEFVRSIDEWKRFSYPQLVLWTPSRPQSAVLQHLERNTEQ
jgi:hypothetical protein